MSKFKLNALDIISIIAIFLILLGIIGLGDYSYIPDLRFLYNRAYQMLDCLKSGNIPWFYYNDFGGVGYGSSFFYGQLTLYPFLVFVDAGIEVFLKVYMIVVMILEYLGICFLAKRFTVNYKYVGLLAIISTFFYSTAVSYGLSSNYMGFALNMFFIAFCIDFFRDKKSFIPASLMFFVVLNTHLISAVLGFVVCCLIALMYFDKSRLKDYVKFAWFTTLVCLYNIVNVIYHSGILTSTDNINKNMLSYLKDGAGTVLANYSSNIPFGGMFFKFIFPSTGYTYLNFGVLLVLLFLCIKSKTKLSKREIFILVLSVLLSILAISDIWLWFNENVFLNPLQFPTRYASYILVFLLILLCRRIKFTKVNTSLLVICCLPELLIGSFFITPLSDDMKASFTDTYCQVMNGEYLDESFIWDSDVFEDLSSNVYDQYGNSYDYVIDDNKVIVTIEANEYNNLTLRFPKLYYRGYKCVDTDGKEYPSNMGYSQFIEVNIEDASDIQLELYYEHPLFLVLLSCVCYGLALLMLIHSVLTFIKFCGTIK